MLGLLLGCRTPDAEISSEQRTERLEQLLTELKDHHNIPAIVVDSNHVIDSLTIGRRNIHGEEPATSDDSFHLGSNTKAVTAFIAGKLVHDGAFDRESVAVTGETR